MTKELIEFEKQAAIAAMQALIIKGEDCVAGMAMDYATSPTAGHDYLHGQ